jgi:hypothetical protein
MRSILGIALVICIAAGAADAGIAITWSKTGTYTVAATGGTFTVEQWQLAASTNDGSKITHFSTFAWGPFVQNWRWEQNELLDENGDPFDPPQFEDIYTPTPTMNNQTTTGNARNADTHLLFSDNQIIPVISPTETNDLSKGSTGSSFPKRAWGLGENTLTCSDPRYDDDLLSYQADVALAQSVQATSVSLLQISFIAGTINNTDLRIRGWIGNGITEVYYDSQPEPATLSLLGLGGLGLLRKRRRAS